MRQAHPWPGSYDIFGRSGGEPDLLIDQVMRFAGLAAGMRVLDLGCGAGDLSFPLARLVGPTGAVIGVDRSREAVAPAVQRAASRGLTNVRFLARDVASLCLAEPVDALIGRLVLMHYSDPAVVLRRLASLVRPGGPIAFVELDIDGARSAPACPLFAHAVERLAEFLTRAGVDARIGLRLGRIFQEAGLPPPRQALRARVERGADSPLYDQIARLTGALLPLMTRTGVAGPDEVAVETLAARLREEAVACDATVVSPSFVGAWTRTVGPR